MDLNKSKDNSSLYDKINKLALAVPMGMTSYIDCPKCGRANKFGMTHKDNAIIYQCFAASCPLKGAVPTSGIFIPKTKLSSILKGLTASSKPFVIPDYFVDGFATVDGLRMAEKYNLLHAYNEGMFQTSYDPKLNRQVFYYVDSSNSVVGAFGRAFERNIRPKAYIYPQSTKTPISITRPSSAGIIVEDLFSAVSCYNAGYTGISLSGTTVVSDYLNYFRGYDKLIIALDKDATIKSVKAKKLLDFVCKDVVILPLQKDIKDMTNADVQVLLGSV